MNAKERISDPHGHYPYKLSQVLRLIEENPAAGPEGDDDDRARITDFISKPVAEASAAYIEAQERYLKDPANAEFKSIYHTARDELVAARRHHRSNRTGATVVAVRGVE